MCPFQLFVKIIYKRRIIYRVSKRPGLDIIRHYTISTLGIIAASYYVMKDVNNMNKRKNFKTRVAALKYHVSGAIERGEAQAIVSIPAKPSSDNEFAQIAIDTYGSAVRANTFEQLVAIGKSIESGEE
jgi:hypothetical protein